MRKRPYLKTISPVLFDHIKTILLQNGKKIRPSLFILSYLGFAKKAAPGLYTSALSTELLHNFILIHDDIIDRSEFRRGRPSIHNMLSGYLSRYKHVKCTGPDLAIILGDIMYALGMEAFLAIGVEPRLKEKALKKLIDAAVCTGSGEFLELLAVNEDIGSITKESIYRIYDLKTGIYSFAAPLTIGAILGGAKDGDVEKLYTCGIYLGRAFQIKDDISDIIADKRHPGKYSLEDIRESKRTILAWYALNNAGKRASLDLKKIMAKSSMRRCDLLAGRRIIIDSGAVEYAEREAAYFLGQAKRSLSASLLRLPYKDQVMRLADKHIAIC